MGTDLVEHILTVSRRMAEMRTLASLLAYVTDEAIRLVNAERGCVVGPAAQGAFRFLAMRDRGGGSVPNAEDQVSTSVIRQVMRTGQPLILHDAVASLPFSRADSVTALQLRSVMCVPLTARGRAIGAICVDNRAAAGCFGEDDLPPLVLFANQAAVAIENAVLNDDLEAQVSARTRELERALTELEASWTETLEANRIRTEFLGYIAHDLRSPLNVVMMSLDLMRTETLGPLNDQQREWVGKSISAVDHVVHLANDLLDLAKIEAGNLSLYPEVVAPSDFLQHVYRVGLGLPWPAGVAFEADIAPDLPALSIDPVRIQQVLLNLLTNAIKYTTQGRVTLYARLQTEKSEILIGIADTGEGIAPEDVNRLFQRFRQVDRNTARRRLGSGLGLVICRELIEKHGGRIGVESTPGAGSNFMFTLPIHRTAQTSVEAPQPVAASA